MTEKQKLAARLVALGLLISAPIGAVAGFGSVTYTCGASEQLTVQLDGPTARVSFGKQHYNLSRHRSSIGEKYLSSQAALIIIDGPSAVFVTNDRPRLGTCMKSVPVASSR